MSIPKHTEEIKKERKAVAPYNFVPLPDEMLATQMPPDQGIFHSDLLTGWIDLEIETCSPTYIRGMYSIADYEKFGDKKTSDLNEEEKIARAPFFAINNVPVIPGSSLRGMIRELVEIVGYGRMRWVSKSPTFTYRAMADKSDDPLKERYKKIFGNMASNVRAGYLVFENGEWYVMPAKTLKKSGVAESKDTFLKVYEEDVSVGGFITMDKANYRPQVVEVSFQRNGRVDKRKELIEAAKEKNQKNPGLAKPIQLDRPCYLIKNKDANLDHSGWLVTSGNMRETGTEKLVRYKHYIFMPPDDSAARLHIPEQVVDDYRAGLTPYQLGTMPDDMLQDWQDETHDASWGCLGNGKPVFYIPGPGGKQVLYFGHNLNFRIPAILDDKKRAVTPLDFVPNHLRYSDKPDMADAILGWVEEWDEEKDENGAIIRKQVGPAGQCAGRVFFSDAFYKSSAKGVWLKPNQEAITPKILSNPKPTTFQHYLVQDKKVGHDPDEKSSLANYTTPPDETSIRGHKFYWHKGNPSLKDLEYEPKSKDEKSREKVLTRIAPVKDGVMFSTRLYFENLRPEELGLLCWVILLPGEIGKTYRHKIGMGKPLGMGSVKLDLKDMFISNRQAGKTGRYAKLFDDQKWFTPELPTPKPDDYINTFEKFLQNQNFLPSDKSLATMPRIKELLELLRWRGETINDEVREATRYMEIEHSKNGNEYKERPVLPTPVKVFDGWFKEYVDSRKLADDYKKQAKKAPGKKPIIKDPHGLKQGEKIKAKVTFAEKKGDVYLASEEFGDRVEFVIRQRDRGTFDRYKNGDSVHLVVLEILSESNDDGEDWFVYCEKA